MTDDERNKLLRAIEERRQEVKTLSSEQALDQLTKEGFCIMDGELVASGHQTASKW